MNLFIYVSYKESRDNVFKVKRDNMKTKTFRSVNSFYRSKVSIYYSNVQLCNSISD